jgi:hypothetical protein
MHEEIMKQIDEEVALEKTIEEALAKLPEGSRRRRELRQELLFQEHARKLQEMRGHLRDNDLEVVGLVYRETEYPSKKRERCLSADSILDDDSMGVVYGPGTYRVQYYERDENGDKGKYIGSVTYHISRDYLAKHQEYKRSVEPALPEERKSENMLGILKGFDTESLKGWAAFIGTMKAMLFPPTPAPAPAQDFSKILEIIIAHTLGGKDKGNSSTFQETLLLELLKNRSDKDPAESMKMVSAIMELSERFAGRGEPKDDRSTIDRVMDRVCGTVEAVAPSALNLIAKQPQPQQQRPVQQHQPQQQRPVQQHQPQSITPENDNKMITDALDNMECFLKEHNGDIAAAAAAVQQKFPVRFMVVKSNPSLQERFYRGIESRFGSDMADKWANAYGLSFQKQPTGIPRGFSRI